MKNRKFYLGVFLCLCGFMWSCQSDYDHSLPKNNGDVDPNLVIAQQNLNSFISFIEPQTKGNGNELTILEVDKKGLPLKLKDSLITPQTRAVSAGIKDSAYLYTFTFMKGENKGYAIVSGEERVPKLYAYVEKGNIGDTTFIEGLRQSLHMIDEIYQDDVLGAYYGDALGVKSSISTFGYGDYTKSITKLEWGQWSPYNLSVPYNCSSNDGGKAPVGCVPVALGMAIAHLEPTIAVKEDQVDKFNKSPRVWNGTPEATLVADFLAKIGSYCQIEYGCDGSGVDRNNAVKPFLHYWVIHQMESKFNDNWTLHCLDDGFPIVAFGQTSSAGHAWLLDGGIKDSSGTKYTHFYNNWGQHGWDNGFFAVTDFCRFTGGSGEVHNYNRNNNFLYIFDVVKL